MAFYRLQLTYEGTAYFGWQKNGPQPTIALMLEEAFRRIHLPLLRLEGASRTDRGVHAQGQVVRCDLMIPLRNLRQTLVGLNSQLPQDIRITELMPCTQDFHPTLDACSKTYHYHFCMGHAQSALYRNFSWHVPALLDLTAMEAATGYLLGRHDFRALTNVKKGEGYSDYHRTLLELQVIPLPGKRGIIVMTGDAFMYKMARNLAGLLIAVGLKKYLPEQLPFLLTQGNRDQLPMTAPAHGLTLYTIHYTPFLPQT